MKGTTHPFVKCVRSIELFLSLSLFFFLHNFLATNIRQTPFKTEKEINKKLLFLPCIITCCILNCFWTTTLLLLKLGPYSNSVVLVVLKSLYSPLKVTRMRVHISVKCRCSRHMHKRYKCIGATLNHLKHLENAAWSLRGLSRTSGAYFCLLQHMLVIISFPGRQYTDRYLNQTDYPYIKSTFRDQSNRKYLHLKTRHLRDYLFYAW